MALLDLQRSFRPGPAQAGERGATSPFGEFFRRLSWTGKAEARVIRLVEIALTILTAIVVGRLFWSLFAPLEGPMPGALAIRAPVGEASAAALPGNPFRAPGAAAAVELSDGPPPEELAETSLKLTLHGTWTDESGGSAVIATPDGLQQRYKVGDAIVPDVTLDRVFRDQVTIMRGGVLESLRMLNRQDVRAPAPPREQAPPPPAQAPDNVAEELSRRLSLGQEVGVIGDRVLVLAQEAATGRPELSLWPLGDRARFEALGLKPGDLLVAVAGAPVGTDLISDATRLAAAANLPQIDITVERQGQRTPVTVPLQDNGDGR